MDNIQVLKWPVPDITVPFSVPGRRAVFFGPQGSRLFVWTECYSDIKLEEHITIPLVVVPTGYTFSPMVPLTHVMSIQNGLFVWHLYQGE